MERTAADRDLADAAWRGITTLLAVQRQRMFAAAAAAGLTMPQAFAVLQLDPDDPPAMRELAGALQCDASLVTAIVDRLEELGLAERRVSAADRRVKELVLTGAGRDVQARLRGAWTEAPAAVRRLSDRDLRDLARVARRMTEGLAVDPSCNPFARFPPRAPRAGGPPGG
ncbi:MAG: MarR family winged helix-turn-helix transcriptional regulator [Actinomycetota bacterium]